MPPKKNDLIMARRRDYAEVFNSDAGQRVLRDLMREFWFFQSSFVQEPQLSAFNEGSRAAVLYILSNIEQFDQGSKEFLDQSKAAALESAFDPLD